MKKIRYFCVILGLLVIPTLGIDFPEFDYKDTSKNELFYKEFESACEQTEVCSEIETGTLEKTRCTLECISPSCYQQIYKFDELEEGEIDVRRTSFKGCFIQRSHRNRGR